MVFQLTASQGGWPGNGVTATTVIYFNSQPHKEADHGFQLVGEVRSISTHSLTRRLTEIMWKNMTFQVFQLTASQGGWHLLIAIFFISFYFNSQPHKEADSKTLTGSLIFFKFQLTASQGGWRSELCRFYHAHYFNSQPHKEADLYSQHVCNF